MKDFYKALRLMTTMTLSCAAAVLGGIWLDHTFSSEPWILLSLLLYALVANFYMLWKGGKDDG